MAGSEPESEAPAESGVEDEPTPAPKPHVEFSPSVVVDVSRDTAPNVKVCHCNLLYLLFMGNNCVNKKSYSII